MAVTSSNGYWYYEWRIGGKKIRRYTGYRVDQISREELRAREAEAKAKVLAEIKAQETSSPAPVSAPGPVSSPPSYSSSPRRYRFLEAARRVYDEDWCRKKSGELLFRQAELVAEIMGNLYLDEINGEVISQLKRALIARKFSPNTINKYLAVVSKILTVAWRQWEVLNRVPFIPRESTEGTARVRVITEDEEQLLLKAAEQVSDEVRDLLIVLMDTGLRISEAVSLSYEANIDFNLGTITIWENRLNNRRQKNDKAKSIPMTTRVREVLLKYRGCKKPFPSIPNNNIAYKRFRKVLKIAGMPIGDIVLHSYRHTFASRLIQRNVNIYDVKELLGHSSVRTTERYYAHMAVQKLQQSIAVLERGEWMGISSNLNGVVGTTPTNSGLIGTPNNTYPTRVIPETHANHTSSK